MIFDDSHVPIWLVQASNPQEAAIRAHTEETVCRCSGRPEAGTGQGGP